MTLLNRWKLEKSLLDNISADHETLTNIRPKSRLYSDQRSNFLGSWYHNTNKQTRTKKRRNLLSSDEK